MFRRITKSVTGLEAGQLRRVGPLLTYSQGAHFHPNQRNIQTTYVLDRTLDPVDKDVIHALYQVAKVPIPISQVADRLAGSTLKDATRYGTLESFVLTYPKYLRLVNGMLSITQLSRTGGSDQLITEMVEFLQKQGNAPQQVMRVFQALSNRARNDFIVTKSKNLADFASKKPHVFVINATNGTLSLTEAAMKAGVNWNDGMLPNPRQGVPTSDRAESVLSSSLASPSSNVSSVSIIWQSLPNGYFIPVKRLFALVCDLEPRRTSEGIDVFLQQLRQLPPRFIDLVSFAGANVPRSELPDHTYARLIGTGVSVHDKEPGDSQSIEFEVVHRFTKELVKYLQPHGEVKMDKVLDLLPPTLQATIPFKGPALMLMFDRMQHMFDINKATMTVRVTGEAGLASKELTIPTSPLPRELRASLELLKDSPLKPVDFEARLSSDARKAIADQFGNLPKFVNAHKPELFLKNGLLTTPHLASKELVIQGVKLAGFKPPAQEQSFMKEEAGGGDYDPEDDTTPHWANRGKTSRVIPSVPVSKMSARQLADYIYQCLPNDRYLSWMSLRGHVDLSVFQHTLLTTGDPRDFFVSRPDLFKTYDPALCNGFIIGKSHIKQPVGTWSEVTDVLSVYKMLAMVCVGGITEAAAIQVLPRDVRAVIKRCGGFEHFVSQVPEWFELRNPVGIAGHSICTYIGHLNPKLKARPSPHPYFIPCIPEHHNITPPERLLPVGGPNSNIDDPYADYEDS